MGKVTNLQRQEVTRVDSRAIKILENSLGPVRCREVMEEACFDMVDKLGKIELALHQHKFDEVGRLAQKIAAMSAQIGLDDFAHAARNLRNCLEQNDPVSLKAVSARMMRLGETSLLSVMQLTEDPYV